LLNKSQPIPLYFQIKESLLNKIKNHIFQDGNLIPSETELQEEYKVSRITIRRAVRELVHEGYLTTRQGKGTFVSKPKARQELNLITSWAETMTNLGMHPETKQIQLSEIAAPMNIVKLLNVSLGDKIYKLERLRYADNEPVCWMINYLNPEFVPDLLKKGLIGESLYETLEKRYKINLSMAIETVESKAARSKESSMLNIRRGAPLLHITRTTYNEDGIPIEVVMASSRADKYAYTVQLVGRPKK
jgi:GntR family transcriptional regulator